MRRTAVKGGRSFIWLTGGCCLRTGSGTETGAGFCVFPKRLVLRRLSAGFVQRGRQRSVAELVKAAAVGAIIPPAALGPHLLRHLRRVGGGQSLELHVMVVNQFPYGPQVASRIGADRGLGPFVAGKSLEGNVFAQVIFRDVFAAF